VGGCSALPTSTNRVHVFRLGYATGLIVGEGSFSWDGRQPALAVKLHARDEQPLHELAALFGGRVYGPCHGHGRHYAVWLLRGAPLRRALPLLERYLPPSYKREQFLAWRTRHFGVLQLDPYDFRVPAVYLP
jgi:hypothetical protein